MFRTMIRLVTLATLGVAGASAALAADVPQDQVDRCLKSVNVIGSSMGHRQKDGPDGQAMLHFTVRSNGQEYDVKCDAATGMVKDVSALSGETNESVSH